MKKTILPILFSTLWISISEVFRNSFLLHEYWINHYKRVGQIFPEQPINGAIWGIWALIFSIVIFILSKKFTFRETVILSWIIGFVLMWLVIGNLGVLPFGILSFAVPLSLVEVMVSVWVFKKFRKSWEESHNN